jgi:hypothetical protein
MSTHSCTRIQPDEKGQLLFPPGVSCYGKDSDGMWWFKHQNEHAGTLFGTHTVTEHEDGTITVSPSIVGYGIHGFLERSIWRDC